MVFGLFGLFCIYPVELVCQLYIYMECFYFGPIQVFQTPPRTPCVFFRPLDQLRTTRGIWGPSRLQRLMAEWCGPVWTSEDRWSHQEVASLKATADKAPYFGEKAPGLLGA